MGTDHQRELERFVSSHVVANVTHFVMALAEYNNANARPEAAEQAAELSCPVEDYESAAIEAGWKGPHTDELEDTGRLYFTHAGEGLTYDCADWRELCAAFDIEPHQREVYEFWSISERLAELLEAEGERIDRDLCGHCVWARTTTGQAIYMDGCVERAWERAQAELAALEAELRRK